MEQQGAATKEIAQSIERMADGTREVCESVILVSEAASHAGLAAGQMLSATSSVAEESGSLQNEVGKFLDAIRII